MGLSNRASQLAPDDHEPALPDRPGGCTEDAQLTHAFRHPQLFFDPDADGPRPLNAHVLTGWRAAARWDS
jgi:hypothetical protein